VETPWPTSKFYPASLKKGYEGRSQSLSLAAHTFKNARILNFAVSVEGYGIMLLLSKSTIELFMVLELYFHIQLGIRPILNSTL
jgi:hypothetical protein